MGGLSWRGQLISILLIKGMAFDASDLIKELL